MKIKSLLFIAVFLVSSIGYSQVGTVDSIQNTSKELEQNVVKEQPEEQKMVPVEIKVEEKTPESQMTKENPVEKITKEIG